MYNYYIYFTTYSDDDFCPRLKIFFVLDKDRKQFKMWSHKNNFVIDYEENIKSDHILHDTFK